MATVPEHTYMIGWIELSDGTHRTIRQRGMVDVSYFIQHCEANGRELTSVRLDD